MQKTVRKSVEGKEVKNRVQLVTLEPKKTLIIHISLE